MSKWVGSVPAIVSVAVDHAESKLRAASVDAETASCVVLALIEAIGNVVRYASAGHRGFELAVEVTNSDVVVKVVDFGPGFVLTSRPMPDVMAEEGRGIPLMQLLCDRVEYHRSRRRNALVLMKRYAA